MEFSHTCSCWRRKHEGFTIVFAMLALMLLLNLANSTEHNYDVLLEKLNNDVRDIFDRPYHKTDTVELKGETKVVTCIAGKICKHDLTKLFGEHNPVLQALKVGKTTLPGWVFTRNNKIIAVPTKKNIGTHKLVFSGLHSENVYLEVRVTEPRQSLFRCASHTDNIIVGSIIFNANVEKLDAAGRLHLLRETSNFLDIDMHRAILVEGRSLNNGDLFGSSVLSAGPGDILLSDEPGITFLWRAKCGADVAGDKTIQRLKSAASDGSLKNDVGYPVIGWFVTSRGPRVRRQAPINPQGTPVPSLGPTQLRPTSAVVMGTPMISATPSLSPVKTIIVMKSSVPVQVTSSSQQPVVKASSPVISPSRSTVKAAMSSIPPSKPVTTSQAPTTKFSVDVPGVTPSTSTQPPVATMTSTLLPTTMPHTSPTPTKKVPPKTLPPVTPGNQHPALINPIPKQVLYVNQLFYYPIDDDMFYDVEDGNTSSLMLKMKVMVDGELLDIPNGFWLHYDEMKRLIYALPGKFAKGLHQFVVIATDTAGASKNNLFTIEVRPELEEHNNIFNVTLDYNFDTFSENLWNRIDLLRRIAFATQASYSELRLNDVQRGSVIFSWSSEAIEQKTCNKMEAEAYFNKISSGEFKTALAPQYIVIDSGSYQIKPCSGNVPGGGGGQTGKSSGWWSRIIIPIIVIIIVLLIIALICCCVYRRKRKYAPPKEDTNGFLHNKKPVIFREEYEEKPDLVCLEPLILPNEKPPVSTPSYAPRTSTPDGAGSSTISTESDEKAPLTSPKDTPRKPPGRSPPPYSS